MGLLKKIFGDYSQKEVKRIRPLCNKVLDLEEEYSRLTDEQLQAKTPEFKQRLANGETLDDILPEAFAACREAYPRATVINIGMDEAHGLGANGMERFLNHMDRVSRIAEKYGFTTATKKDSTGICFIGERNYQEFIKNFRELFLDIHSQHQSYNYVQQKNHILLLDNFALPAHKNNVLLFKTKYEEYLQKTKYSDIYN